MQPLLDRIQQTIGEKNLGLLRVLLPDLSGQSFIAVTHFDPEHPSEIGLVAGMKPRLGRDTFDTFVQQVKTAYPDLARDTHMGHDTLLGVDYQWIESTRSPGRVCVARAGGWIITAWGEASLQDFLERVQGKSTTPSLADTADFKMSHDRVGADAQTLVYCNYARVMDLVTRRFTASNPAMAENLKKRLAGMGGAAIGTRFDHGEIVDRFSVLEPRATQEQAGMVTSPATFDTLKFTGPDTRFYFAADVNWPQVWKNFQAQLAAGQPGGNPLLQQLQIWAQSENLDLEKNVFDALGQEYSIQVEWAADSLYPDVSVLVKVDKPDDFKPAIAALIDYSRKEFATSAVINEMQANGHSFATLKLVQPMPVSPTITEDGPYFGFFLNETNAVRSLARDGSTGLLHNDEFNRQLAGERDGATQLFFLDAPRLLDQAYRTALPYLSFGAMVNPTLASLLKDRQLPPDLSWVAPMGTWVAAFKSDDAGITGYSRSGIGNQGILLAGGLGAGAFTLQSLGFLPQHRHTETMPVNPYMPPPVNAQPAVGGPPVPATPPAAPAATAPTTPSAPPDATSPPSPPGSTH